MGILGTHIAVYVVRIILVTQVNYVQVQKRFLSMVKQAAELGIQFVVGQQ
jgi:hypothetical protein